MGKAGKRKEMEDRRAQKKYVEGRCMKEFRVKVLLMKEMCIKAWCIEVVCGEESCVKERYGIGVDVNALRAQCIKHCMSKLDVSAIPATQSGGRCRQQPQRPRRQTGIKRATRPSPAPKAPRRPRKVEVDVAKCHACHGNSRGDHFVKREPSAPPEPAQSQPSAESATPTT